MEERFYQSHVRSGSQIYSSLAGAIWRTYWSYGDGTQSQDFNSKHEYAQAGKYQVCLKVVSLNECITYYCDSVIVRLNDTCLNKSGFKMGAVT
ncbi:MAG: PKD domain-containing protein [Chitinophagaceae bacterium]|nr:PKD domain-containing protein [Chitinophagaceae bacterium]